jgi:hypothetical protein
MELVQEAVGTGAVCNGPVSANPTSLEKSAVTCRGTFTIRSATMKTGTSFGQWVASKGGVQCGDYYVGGPGWGMDLSYGADSVETAQQGLDIANKVKAATGATTLKSVNPQTC